MVIFNMFIEILSLIAQSSIFTYIFCLLIVIFTFCLVASLFRCL